MSVRLIRKLRLMQLKLVNQFGKGGGRGKGGGGRGGGRGGKGGGRGGKGGGGSLACQVVGCTNMLTVKKSDNFRKKDGENKSIAANGGQKDPKFSPTCTMDWDCGEFVKLNNTKSMDMAKYQKLSGHNQNGQAESNGKKFQQRHNVNAAVGAADFDADDDDISDAVSLSGVSLGDTIETPIYNMLTSRSHV
jgi:hypothetical protein